MEPTATTFLLIISTGLVSWVCFTNREWREKLIFRPNYILAGREYYRLLTSGFLHADLQHLLFNMISLYFFGRQIETDIGILKYLTIYFGSIVGGGLVSLWIHRNHDYSALGASGGVCGVIYASIFLFPGSKILIFPLPIGIPAWLYAIIFLLASFYGMRAQRDNIGHDAHLGGAICGLLITTAFYPSIVELNPGLFAAVLGISIALLLYLVVNPLFLPPRALWTSYRRKSLLQAGRSSIRHEESQRSRMDAILDKISREGLHSLSAEEKAFLRRMSDDRP